MMMKIRLNWHEWNGVNVEETDLYKTDEMKHEADSRNGMMRNEMSD